MRRDNATGIQGRAREFGPHPVPARAASFGHLAAYFHSEGSRDLGGRMSGDEGAAELTRLLRAPHRVAMLP